MQFLALLGLQLTPACILSNVSESRSVMPKCFNGFVLVGLLFLVSACTDPRVKAQSPATPTVSVSENLFTKDELYFGLSKPRGGMISEAEWQVFLSRVITPRFPEGLTVVDAYGQYLNKQGKLNREKTKLVILIYENSQAKNQLIEQIIANYKQTFRQESVLRVTSSVKATF